MNNELAEIKEFIEKIPPFNCLCEADLLDFVSELSISYLRQGDAFPPAEVSNASLYFIRRGVLSYKSADKELIARYSEGDLCRELCKEFCLSSYQEDESQTDEKIIEVDEDTLVYHVPCQSVTTLCAKYPEVDSYFNQDHVQRLKQNISNLNESAIISSTLINTAVSNFYNTPVAFIEQTQTIQQAAILMTEQQYSCLVVTLNDEPVGIITDKDIRRRCVAQGLPTNSPVSDIMTQNITSIDLSCNAHDALMTMTFNHLHHLPVTEKGKVVGMVSATDLMANEGHNAINLSALIHKATRVEELVDISLLLPKLQYRLVTLGCSPDYVGKNISALTRAFTKQLILLAQKDIGQAPVPFVWLAAGSQARQEQLVHSDQDNALLISDNMKPEDDAWFEKLAHFVCDGLAACGFIYCPGNNMATNPVWRQPERVWQKYFDDWIEKPEPKALLNACIFFDLDSVAGEEQLLTNLRQHLLAKTKSNTLFINYITKNALQRRPPLGFFRDFVLKQNGTHYKTLDLKKNGIAPIVDLARLVSLSLGIDEVNTIERIKQASASPILPKEAASSLLDAFELLTTLRLKHQASNFEQKLPADNYLSPKTLSKLEREHLKDAFKVVKSIQDTKQAGLNVFG